MFCKRWCQPPLPGCGGDTEPVSCLQSNRKHSSHLLPSPTPVSHLLLSPQQEHLWPLATQMQRDQHSGQEYTQVRQPCETVKTSESMWWEGPDPGKSEPTEVTVAFWKPCVPLETLRSLAQEVVLEMLGRVCMVQDGNPAKMLNMYVMRLKFEC